LRDTSSDICVISTVEDADFLARGLISELEAHGFADRIHFTCLWNDKIATEGVSLSPITRQYVEEFNPNDAIFVVVKAIISGACVVKTNLTRAITFSDPKKVLVAAPVMLEGAETRLQREFPSSISSKFEFLHFAIDNEKNGEDVVPGVGGSLYELLGLRSRKEKNRYVPQIVKEPRNRLYGNSGKAFA